MLQTVKSKWYALMPQDAYLGEKGAVAIRFQINADGKIDGAYVEKSSAVETLDKAALDAVNASTPLDSLPADFRGPNIELRTLFFYNQPIDYGSHTESP